MAWFDCAVRKPISCNFSGSLYPIGVVMHQQVGYGTLYNWFNNPQAEVSAHFWAGQHGDIEQYVDSINRAWHGVNLNNGYLAIEFEGMPEEPLTASQVEAGGAILAEAKRRHACPLVMANANGEHGFGYHRMAGSGTSTECPSDLRLEARQAILNEAGGVPAPPAATKPPEASTSPSKAPPWPGVYLRYPPVTTDASAGTWQAQMAHRGWTITVDGQYGPQSADVCESFQREKHLGVDGVVGPETWAASWNAPIT